MKLELQCALLCAKSKRTKNATLKELALSRLALEENRQKMEERLMKVKEEEETKRQQMYLATQLEIAKVLAHSLP